MSMKEEGLEGDLPQQLELAEVGVAFWAAGAAFKNLGSFGSKIGKIAGVVGRVASLFGRFIPFVGMAISLFQGINAIFPGFVKGIGDLYQNFTEFAGISSAAANSIEELSEASSKGAAQLQAAENVRGIEGQIEEIYAKAIGERTAEDYRKLNSLSTELIKAQATAAKAMTEFSNSLSDVIDRIEDKRAGERTELENQVLNLSNK